MAAAGPSRGGIRIAGRCAVARIGAWAIKTIGDGVERRGVPVASCPSSSRATCGMSACSWRAPPRRSSRRPGAARRGCGSASNAAVSLKSSPCRPGATGIPSRSCSPSMSCHPDRCRMGRRGVGCVGAVRRFEVAPSGHLPRHLFSVFRAARPRARGSGGLRDAWVAGRWLFGGFDGGGQPRRQPREGRQRVRRRGDWCAVVDHAGQR